MQKSPKKETSPHYLGHRQRLRERLLCSGADALQDYELLEVLLFAAVPRRDVKPIAKKLLSEFKSLWALVNAPAERLIQSGLSENAAATLVVSGALALRAQKKEIVGGTLLNNWQRMIDYCRMAMAHESVEQFRLLFLDRKNRLLSEENSTARNDRSYARLSPRKSSSGRWTSGREPLSWRTITPAAIRRQAKKILR